MFAPDEEPPPDHPKSGIVAGVVFFRLWIVAWGGRGPSQSKLFCLRWYSHRTPVQ